MMFKICVVTGTRAEYGLLLPLMRALQSSSEYKLQVMATGMHLSPEFGLTYQQIEQDGFTIDEKVEMLLSADTDTAIIKSTGLGMIGFADAFNRLQPNAVVILGDRFEAFAAATAAYLAKLPVIHLHGGELTEGASDEGLRHAITKMSFLHFTSTESYRQRVIQLGESPDRVFNVGAIGLDNIRTLALLDKDELAKQLKFSLDGDIIVVTFHPVTLENNTAADQMQALLLALEAFSELRIVFTLPNADANGRVIIKLINDFVQNNSQRSAVYTSLGQVRYLSLLKYVKAVVGNSSSGIIEAPSFGIPTLNIGDRQKGRVRAASVIDVDPQSHQIVQGLKKALSNEFQLHCRSVENPYGTGYTTDQILKQLCSLFSIRSTKKSFYDLQ